MTGTNASGPTDLRPERLIAAVDEARAALEAQHEGGVGAYLGFEVDDATSVTHRFEAELAGYRGWQWAVVVAAPEDAEQVTVSESALLPGPGALVAPQWVPYSDRVRGGDLGPGDLLAPAPDDPRLVPGTTATGDPAVDETAGELGLGRRQVMSREGRLDSADRWYHRNGPRSTMAREAPALCGTCAFYLPLAGSLGAAFGVCGNEFSADGAVVHAEYGCGAHSDTELPQGASRRPEHYYDDAVVESMQLAARGDDFVAE